MGDRTISKLALAQKQLEMAIQLFVSRRDRVSAITLAGAADGILHGLVLKAGKQPFSDYALATYEAIAQQTPKKSMYARHINDKLKINDLKHMDENSPDDVTLDVDMSAMGAILKAIANHHTLVPEHPEFIRAMLQWTWMFYDGQTITEDEPYTAPGGLQIMKSYKERPEAIVKMEKRFAAAWQHKLKTQSSPDE